MRGLREECWRRRKGVEDAFDALVSAVEMVRSEGSSLGCRLQRIRCCGWKGLHGGLG